MDPTFLEYLVGPAGAVVVLVVILAMMLRIVENRILPAVGRLVERHFAQIDAIIAGHERDREAWREDVEESRLEVERARELARSRGVH